MAPTTLCQNRFPLSGAPSTCALDAAIVPLPSFLLLAFFITAALFRRRVPHLTAAAPVLPKWLHITYVLLLFAAFAMRALEIARLVAAHQGVGLLPAGLVSLGFVGAVMAWQGRSRGATFSLAFVLYWFLMTAFEAVKVARLSLLNKVDPAKGTLYPSSDWLLDNAVMLGLYVIFIIIESLHLVVSGRRPRREESTEKGVDHALLSSVN